MGNISGAQSVWWRLPPCLVPLGSFRTWTRPSQRECPFGTVTWTSGALNAHQFAHARVRRAARSGHAAARRVGDPGCHADPNFAHNPLVTDQPLQTAMVTTSAYCARSSARRDRARRSNVPSPQERLPTGIELLPLWLAGATLRSPQKWHVKRETTLLAAVPSKNPRVRGNRHRIRRAWTSRPGMDG